jgi:hypothetical protein
MSFVYIHIACFGCWVGFGSEGYQILDLAKAIHAETPRRPAA